MLKGIHLTLMIGPGAPAPVPRYVLDALTAVTVTTSAREPSGFELKFQLSNRSPLQTLFLLAGSAVPKIMRVIVVATVNGTPEVLIDGVMAKHQIAPGSDGALQLTVTGDDLSRVMDFQDLNGLPFPGMPTAARVVLILAKYAMFGVIPLVIPPFLFDVDSPFNYVALQKGTDWNYLRLLAQQVGHVCYHDPGPAPGTSRLYWGPEIKSGQPQPALNYNMDAHTNVESLGFDYNSEERIQPVVTLHEPITKLPIPLPVPDISILNPALGLIQSLPKRIEQLRDLSKLPFTKALLRAIGPASESADTSTVNGTLDVGRYGRLLKARRLVGLRGAGQAMDGLYYVQSVTHQIARGSYKQSFKLSRNGLVSTVQKVPA